MNSTPCVSVKRTSSVQVNGTVVRIIFSPEKNSEAPAVVRDILKGAYLRNQRA